MKKVILQILTVLVLSISISAQNEKPILHDEFGPLALGDLSSRLDGFRNELRSKDNSLALIRIYGGTNESLSFPYMRKAFYEAYFTNFDFNDRNKLTVQICDGDEPRIRNQFFIISTDTKLDDCGTGLEVPQKTRLIKTEDVYEDKSKKLLDTADDYLGTKGVDKAVAEADKNFLIELLKKSPDSSLYLIGYAGRYFKPAKDGTENEVFSDADSLKVNDKTLKRIKNELVKKGIEPSRILTVRGRYTNDSRKIEFYFVPKNGEIPKPKYDEFPEKKEK